jgi:hydrogenase-4 component E
MSDATVGETINGLGVAMVVLGIALLWVRRPAQAIVVLACQSLVLGAVGLIAGEHTERGHLLAGGALVVVAKGVLVPGILLAILQTTRSGAALPSSISRRATIPLAILGSLVVVERFSGEPFATPLGADRALGAALAIILLGLATMVTRHHVVAQLTGFLAIENGMALGALTAALGLPFVVELGVLLDALLAVMVAFYYTQRIHEIHGDIRTSVLRGLRG